MKPFHLKIIGYPDTAGFYLIHLDRDGRELANTFHDTLDEATEQTAWEFNIQGEEWRCNCKVLQLLSF